ncbi:MAG: hypothetical protein JNL28_02295 [Planctomycetes bacterium]|nr:hypothetical protein [Planctomycetota bacterium]
MSVIEWGLWGLAAAVVSFVAAELVARAWLARFGRAYVWAPYGRVRMYLDREVLPTLEPIVEHHTNAEGERGDWLPDDTSSMFRILVVGGSAAECWFLDQASSWPNIVQKTLREPQNRQRLGVDHVHVGNIGRSLVTTRHLDAILARVLPHYAKVDAIVFMVGVSDLILWLEQGAPKTLTEEPIPSSALFTQHPDGPFGWRPGTLALRRIASAWNRRLRRPITVRERVGKRLGEVRLMRQNAREMVHEMPDPTAMLAGFERWFEILLERAKQKSPHVLVVHQPWLEREFTPEEEKLLWSFGAGRPYAGVVTRYYDHDVAWKLHRLVDRSVTEVAQRAGVEQLDVMPLVPADFEHYYDDHHHTPKGCDIIGRAVAEKLLASARAHTRAPEH